MVPAGVPSAAASKTVPEREQNVCPPGQVPAAAQALAALSQAAATGPEQGDDQDRALAGFGIDPARITALDRLALKDAGAKSLKDALSAMAASRILGAGCLKEDRVTFSRIELRFDLEASPTLGSARLSKVLVQRGEPVSAAALDCIQGQVGRLVLPPEDGQAFTTYTGEAVQYLDWGAQGRKRKK